MTTQAPDPNLPERLTRLEESHAFAERTSEQLAEQVIALFQKMDALDRRLMALEGRLEALAEGDRDEEE